MSKITVLAAQVKPKKGDYAHNVAQIGGIFAQMREGQIPADVLVLPETALSGYFLEGGVRDAARTKETLFNDLNREYVNSGAEGPLDIVVGFYEQWDRKYYNSCMYASLGKEDAGIVHVHRKFFLPTYGVFDEKRFVSRGRQIVAFPTRFGHKAAVLVCEDAWHSITPTIAALKGAQILYVVAASPARGFQAEVVGNVTKWGELLRTIADEHCIWVVQCGLVGFEGGKGFVGASLAVDPFAKVRMEGPVGKEALLSVDVDLDDVGVSRAANPLLADLEANLADVMLNLAEVEQVFALMYEHIPAPPFDPESDEPLKINEELVAGWLVDFIQDELTRRRGFKNAVVGLSGGVDSALTATLCAMALGPEHVLGVRMPYKSSSQELLEHGKLVADKLGIVMKTIEITDAVDGYLDHFAPDADGRRRGNVMARMRMIVLFDQSEEFKALPIGTGNKSERLFGYFTWHADDSPPINPLGDLYKTQVWALSRYLGVPDEIVNKPASADLVVGQTDELDFGITYARADRILTHLVRGYKPERLVEMGFPAEEVALVKRRLDGTHWKRHLPTVAMLSSTSINDYYLRPVDY